MRPLSPLQSIQIIVLLLVGTLSVSAQTCCSGGVPLSNSLGFALAEKGQWQVMAGYDLNVMNTLKSGREVLEDNTRKRTTHAFLSQVGFTASSWFAIDVFFPYVTQERSLTPIGQPSSFSRTSGIGDLVIMPKFKVFRQIQVGVGIKMPTGATDKTNDDGLVLSADLQPGTGSWDAVFWANGLEEFDFRPSMSIHATLSYRATGTNRSYLGDQEYTFGNEFQATVGVADQFLLFSQIFDPSLSLKLRTVQPDVRDEFTLPSTGGTWLFIRPGLVYQFRPSISLQGNAELPLFANLDGTQVTTTYRLNFSLLFLM